MASASGTNHAHPDGWQLGIAFPVYLTGNRSSSVRFSPTLGFSMDWQRLDGFRVSARQTIVGALEIGFTARFGSRVGFIINPAWSLTRVRGVSKVYPAAGRIMMGAVFGRFTIGFAGRIVKANGFSPYGSGGLVLGMTY